LFLKAHPSVFWHLIFNFPRHGIGISSHFFPFSASGFQRHFLTALHPFWNFFERQETVVASADQEKKPMRTNAATAACIDDFIVEKGVGERERESDCAGVGEEGEAEKKET